MLRYLLDTNIVIYVLKRRPPQALHLFNQHAGRTAFSVVTLAELLHGAEKSNDPSANLVAVEDFCRRSRYSPPCRRSHNTTVRSERRWSGWARPSA